MAKVLNVPYRSQWDDDAHKRATNSGPACLAMILGYFGKQVTIKELYATAGVKPSEYVGFGKLQQMARAYGFTFQYEVNRKLNDLKRWIDEDKPVIALVKYSYWSQIEPGVSTQSSYSGPQFVVVIGYGDGGFYINDPNYRSPRREEGRKKAWSEVLFNLAWSNVRVPNLPNPNNAVIVPIVAMTDADEAAPESTDERDSVEYIEYTVKPGDTWSGLAGRFLQDQTLYPELLAFNNLSPGAPLFVGQKLRIPLAPRESEDLPIILGEGALQTVDASLVRSLKEKWVGEGKLAATADRATVLRAFVQEIELWTASEPQAIEYVVQPGDTWAGIAGRFLGDQMRYPEIMKFNQAPPGAPLLLGQKIRIPSE